MHADEAPRTDPLAPGASGVVDRAAKLGRTTSKEVCDQQPPQLGDDNLLSDIEKALEKGRIKYC